MNSNLPLAVALGAATAAPALAAEPLVTAPIQVTATRTPVTTNEALASVSVLTREDIEAREPRDLPDLLSGLAGVSIARNGGRGQPASLFLRGTNSNHTLVLIDGVRVGSATLGRSAIEALPVSQIERVEVVRGPRATLYGADALGGVVQIFTRENDSAHVNTGLGNRSTALLDTGFGQQFEQGSYSINAGSYTTDGFDAREATSGPFGIDQPDDDGYHESSFSARGEYRPSETLRLHASVLRSESRTEFDAAGADETDGVQQVLTAGASWQASEICRLAVTGGQTLDDGDSRDTGGDRFTTRRRQLTVQNDIDVGTQQTVTLGVDYYREEVSGTLDFQEQSRDNAAVFAQHQWLGARWETQVGLRHDDNEAFGGHTTTTAAVGYRLTSTARAFASFGTAFKAPTFNDLYYPDTGFFRGNPDLDPERSRSWELGVKGGDAVRWSVSAFHTEIDDLIAFDGAAGTSVNVNEARIRGLEARAAGRIAGMDAELAWTFVDPRDVATDNILPRRPRRSASLRLARELGVWRLGGTLNYAGERYDDVANTVELGSYTTLDLRLDYRFRRHWEAGVAIANATDADYQTVDTYRAPGRTVLFTLNWRQQPR